MPRGVEVEARSSSGRVTVTGVDGSVLAHSQAGAVTVDDIGGAVDLSSSAGRIEGTRLRSELARGESSAGRVTLGFVVPPRSVTARSSAGEIAITVPPDGTAYRVVADSSVGDTRVGVARDNASDRTIDASTSSGVVSITYGAAR